MSQKSQVLVVDDDLAMCGFLRTFLGTRNYNALTVTNADEAVRRFHAERPAAVLLDVVMPGSMDGLAALAAVAKAAAMKAERAVISDTLRQVHWNRRKAAQLLGVSYKTLLNKIKETGIERP